MGGWGKRFYLFSFFQSRRVREAGNPAGGQKGRGSGEGIFARPPQVLASFCPPPQAAG